MLVISGGGQWSTATPSRSMRPGRVASRLAVLTGVLVVAASMATAVGRAMNAGVPNTGFAKYWPLVAFGGVAYGATGGWLAAVRPRLPLGWLMLGVGAPIAVGGLCGEYAIAAVDRHPSWPAPGAAFWVYNWSWVAGYLTVALVLPLLLPTGWLPSRRLRPLLVLASVLVVLNAAAFAVTPYVELDVPVDFGGLRNPTAVPALTGPAATVPLALLTLGCLAAGLTVLVRRWCASRSERAGLSWIALGVLSTVVLGLSAFLVPDGLEAWASGLATIPLPLAVVIAVLRHGLWDVQFVLSRSLAYTLLSALVIGVYVALVGALGGVLGATTGVPILATAGVAVLVIPLHGRVQALVNRLVYGEIEAPDVLLARLGERAGRVSDPASVAAEVLPEVVARCRRLLRADRAEIRSQDDAVLAADGVPPGPPMHTLPLVHAGVEVGALRIAGDVGGSRRENRLLTELTHQLAVLVHAATLAEELRRSRERLVTAREAERRRMHRDLHDGVGPALAAAALQVETARDVCRRDPVAAEAILSRATARLQSTVEDVRSVAHGLRPQPLDDLGLVDALHELAARYSGTGRSVTVTTTGLSERSAAVDVALYLVAAEAVSNGVRHGRAGRVEIRLADRDGGVELTVIDDGLGLPEPVRPGLGMSSMRQRAEELGGTCIVGAGEGGRGATVTARLPASSPETDLFAVPAPTAPAFEQRQEEPA